MFKGIFRKIWDRDLLQYFHLSKTDAQVTGFISLMASFILFVSFMRHIPHFQNKILGLTVFLTIFFLFCFVLVPVFSWLAILVTKGKPSPEN